MRYPQGDGLTAEGQAFREQVRMLAADRFFAGVDCAVIAKALRVHVRSVQRWRAAWDAGGGAALLSKALAWHHGSDTSLTRRQVRRTVPMV